MAKKIFIAATGQNTGKTTTSLFLLYLARKTYGRVGYIKPLGPKPALLNGVEVDKDAALMASCQPTTSGSGSCTPVQNWRKPVIC
jgi:uncharacterized protein